MSPVARRVVGSIAALLAVAGLAGCASAPASEPASAEITVSAAASLRGVLTSTAPEFEAANDVRVTFNFGASGQLMKQIEGGAPADVFLSASPSAVAALASEGLVPAGTPVVFAGNTLVILVPAGNPSGIDGPNDLGRVARLTTGDPEVAPHGQKAREWLTGIAMWDQLAPKFVFAANAAQTDDYVARGEVDAGIGFASDAEARDDIEVAYVVPYGAIKPITYVGAALGASKEPDLAEAYLAYLLSPRMQRAFADAGFEPAPKE